MKMGSLLPLLIFILLTLFSQRFTLFPVAVASLDLKNTTSFTKKLSSLRLERIQKHLNKINKSPVMTIQSPDGDMIDCVHKRKQPALDHPLLINHKIQKVAPERPKGMKKAATSSSRLKEGKKKKRAAWGHQTWHANGTRCPTGTVPIRRTSMRDVLRAKSLFDYGKKSQRRSNNLVNTNRQADAPDVVSGNGHEHAIAYTGASSEVYGARATINVWTPQIEEINEFSLSQIWVLSGSFDGTDLNSIEAGWQSGQSGALW